MFNNSKYSRWYFRIIDRAKARQKPKPAENHHVIPECFGGKETVALTLQEHFICHLLLPKMVSGKERKQMLWALHRMMHSSSQGQNRYIPSSKIYEQCRKRFIEEISKPKSSEHLRKIRKAIIKMNKDPEIIKRKSESRKGLTRTSEQCVNISVGTSEGMSDPKVVAKMKRSSKKRWSNPEARKKIANQNSRTFKLTHRQTGKIIIVKNLAQYCRDHRTHHRKIHLEFIVESIPSA